MRCIVLYITDHRLYMCTVNPTNKSMALELMLGIFSWPRLADYFYTNDRNVLIDVLMRDIADLGDGSDAVRGPSLGCYPSCQLAKCTVD